MRMGLFGARADMRGLAYQTAAFAKHLDFDRVYGIDMTADDLSPYPCDWRLYESLMCDLAINRHSRLQEKDVRRWLRGLDVVLGAETFYRDEFPIWAKEEGVRTVLQVNPEFAGWWDRRGEHLPRPDVILAPTVWRMKEMPGAIHLPFPVDREVFPFRLRTEASRFVHIAGHRAAADRAGTRTLLSGLPRLRGKDIVIRSQSPLGFSGPALRYAKLEQVNVSDPVNLYQDADVVLLPRRYGGNCLVANEALSSGCPVIMLDREPENTWGGVLTLGCKTRGQIRTKAGPVPIYEAKSGALGEAVLRLEGCPDLVREYSEQADIYADSISWDVLLPRYMDTLKGC